MSPSPQRQPRVWWVNQFAVTPDRPGGTRHHEMAAALRNRGRDVVVLASDLDLGTRAYTRRRDARDRRHLQEDADGVPFVWVPAGSYERNDWRRAASMLVFALHAGLHLLRHVRPGDVVIGSSPHLPGALTSWAVARLRRARSMHEVRDLWPESLVAVLGRTNALARVLRVVADLLYRRSDAVVVLARGSGEVAVARGAEPARVHWIPNGVTVDAARAATPDDLSWVAGQLTFVYAGAHGPANGLDLVLDAAVLLQSSSDPIAASIRVLLIGDGVDRPRLAARVAGEGLTNVVLHEPIPKASVRTLLEASTGGLMVLKDVPLFRFGVSPNKLYDYLAADLPVITNVAGDVADIVTSSGGGIVVDPEDSVAFAAAMRRIAADGWPPGGGPAYVNEHHDRVRLAERLDGVIDEVLALSAAPRRGAARSRVRNG